MAAHADAAHDRDALKQAHVEARAKAETMRRLTRDAQAPASLDDVTVDRNEYPPLLEAAYRRESFPKPRNALGLVKDLPVPAMEDLMLTNAQVTEEDLRQLANRRTRSAKGNLVETGKVPAERIVLVSPKPGGGQAGEKGGLARAEFTVK